MFQNPSFASVWQHFFAFTNSRAAVDALWRRCARGPASVDVLWQNQQFCRTKFHVFWSASTRGDVNRDASRITVVPRNFRSDGKRLDASNHGRIAARSGRCRSCWSLTCRGLVVTSGASTELCFRSILDHFWTFAMLLVFNVCSTYIHSRGRPKKICRLPGFRPSPWSWDAYDMIPRAHHGSTSHSIGLGHLFLHIMNQIKSKHPQTSLLSLWITQKPVELSILSVPVAQVLLTSYWHKTHIQLTNNQKVRKSLWAVLGTNKHPLSPVRKMAIASGLCSSISVCFGDSS